MITDMRRLLNTLYITTENAYASLDGENVVVKVEDEVKGRFPLHILEGIYIFSYAGASPALIEKCTQEHIDLVLCSPTGRFMAKPVGRISGNVLLRREQYRIADDERRSCHIARNMVVGKVMNQRQVISRAVRDHPDRVNTVELRDQMEKMYEAVGKVVTVESKDVLRGLEGATATHYFFSFDDLILRDKDHFFFHGRNRRPPLDNINALLSYTYMMVTSMCQSALETVGLDPYVGFMHTDRAGRVSLALDLVEELRPCLADRFVLSIVNNGEVTDRDFIHQDSGAVLLDSESRKRIQIAWQKKKQDKIMHPYLKEKIEWGLIPYVQAMLLARFIRGDIDGYPPFVWR